MTDFIGNSAGNSTADLVAARVRMRARRLALWMGQVWEAGQSSPDQGLAVTAGEVGRLLLDPALALEQEAVFYATDPAAAALAGTVASVDAAIGADPGWQALRQAFGLEPAEADFLSLLLAVEIDPGLHRVVAYLHDDARLIHPTPWLAARLFQTPLVPLAGASLLRWLLAAPVEGAPGRLATAWQADPAVALSIATGTWQEPQLDGAVRRIAPAQAAALPMLHKEALEALGKFGDAPEIELAGPEGIGRETLAAQAAGATGRALVVADAKPLLADAGAVGDALVRLIRLARCTGGIAYIRNAEAVPPADWAKPRRLGVPFCRGVRQPGGEAPAVVLGPVATVQRLALWAHLSADPPPSIVASQRLTPAEIVRAADVPTEAMRAAVRRRVQPNSELLVRLPLPYAWDDLVLPADVERQLREFENQVRLRWTVYEEWGFQRLAHLGNGITALFGGPSGTGKTMAAQVIARALDLDLFRVDLAGVINKYVGETEKRLRDVFDACESAGALLFFDEADALFGSRMQVKDAHDRFANIEIDYLLQRLERFDGVAILATNRKNDLDSAFLRRLRFVVEFLAPRAEERLLLWQRALLPCAPSGEEILDAIDWHFLADRMQMTGAEIKGTALAAAFVAKAEGARIGMRHLLAAAHREMTKQGTKLRVPLREAAAP